MNLKQEYTVFKNFETAAAYLEMENSEWFSDEAIMYLLEKEVEGKFIYHTRDGHIKVVESEEEYYFANIQSSRKTSKLTTVGNALGGL